MAGLILSDEELDRYARHIVLKEIGGGGQMRLKRATVMMIGAGGIGAPAIQYLAAAGVGRLVLLDDDHVERSNLQRQVIFGEADIGDAKTAAAAAAAGRINGHVMIEAHQRRFDVGTPDAVFDKVDVIVDGSDNFTTRLAVSDVATRLAIPLVSAAVTQFEGQLGVFRGWQADKPCYRCFVGSDPDRAETSCAEAGVLGAMAGVMGSLAALEAIRCVAPFGDDPAGSLLLLDLLGWRFRTLRLPKDPACPACGQIAA